MVVVIFTSGCGGGGGHQKAQKPLNDRRKRKASQKKVVSADIKGRIWPPSTLKLLMLLGVVIYGESRRKDRGEKSYYSHYRCREEGRRGHTVNSAAQTTTENKRKDWTGGGGPWLCLSVL